MTLLLRYIEAVLRCQRPIGGRPVVMQAVVCGVRTLPVGTAPLMTRLVGMKTVVISSLIV